MSNKYNKQLLTEIHKYNHIETSETAFISNNDLQYEVILHDKYTVEDKIVKINGPLNFGIYYFNDYIFLLDIDMVEGEYIEWIRNTKFTHVVRLNGTRHCLKLFKIYNLDFDQKNKTGVLNNTVNTEVDKIFITGNTNIEIENGSVQSPDNIAKLISTTKIRLTSQSLEDKSLEDNFEIRLKSGLKSLPSGIGDILVLDNINSKSYRINKIGRIIITGHENWTLVKDLHISGKDGYSTYFFNTDYPQIGNNTTDVICNYFPTISYSEMFTEGGLTYAISNSNDFSNNGFYIRVSNKIANNDVAKFKKWLIKSSYENAIILECHLMNYSWKEISLDRYDFRTYFGGTKIVTTDNVNKISLFCKTFGIQYANFIPTGTAIDTLSGIKDTVGETYIYAGGQVIYKYSPDYAKLYASIDKYYGAGNGVNSIVLPNQDKIGGDDFKPSMLNYQFYISNQNPKIDTNGYIPVGGIIQWYVEDKIPEGFLLYRGEEVSRTEYSDLFEVLGTTYGEGDGSTTFNLPNQDYNEENITQEEIDSIGFNFLICYKPETTLPIGACLVWYGNYNLPPAGFVQADGGKLNKLDYYDLYKLFGNKYGETNDEFGLPDQNVYDYADKVLEYDKLENFSYIIKAL